MRTKPLIAVVAVLLLAAASAAPAKDLPTNSELLGRAVHQAVDTLMTGLRLGGGSHVVVLPAPGQQPAWALENSIAAALRSRGIAQVSFHGPRADSSGGNSPAPGGNSPAPGGNSPAPGGNSPAPGGSAPASGGNVPASGDNASASGDNASAPGDNPGKDGKTSSIDTRPIDPSAELLEYRVSALGVTYTDSHKKLLFGATQMERLARVAIAVRHLGPDGRLLSSSEANALAEDRVPADQLPRLEDNLYQSKSPIAPSRDLTRLLEPAIVVALVTGLVFLFYTNRN